jgi:hypothetical protein
MTSYAWFPVSGFPTTGTVTATSTLSWSTGTFNWNSPSNWIDYNEISFTGSAEPSGTTPASGTGTSGGAGDDSVGLVAGSINPTLLAAYDDLYAPSHNDPNIASSDLSVDVLLNSGTVDLANLLMAGFAVSDTNLGLDAVAQYPTVDVEGADFIVGGTILNTYTVVLPSDLGGTEPVSGGGTIDIGSAGTVEAAGSVQADIQFNFRDSDSDILKLDALSAADTVAFAGTITSFGAGDTIWLPNLPTTLDDVTTTATYNPSGHLLTLAVGGSESITIDLAGSGLTAANSVLVTPDANGGIDLVTCFAAGTGIATPRGELPVEDLRAGDLVQVHLGETAQPVVWVGRRHLDCRRHASPRQAWPIRIRAGAFGAGRPYRDLWLSPDHAVYVNDVLVPAKRLVNGSTIEQIEVDAIDYYHVELPRHDVLLANGLAVESFLDVNGNRGFFANGGTPVILHPDLTALAWEANGCAPLVVTGPQLDAVRDRVNQLAGADRAAA